MSERPSTDDIQNSFLKKRIYYQSKERAAGMLIVPQVAICVFVTMLAWTTGLGVDFMSLFGFLPALHPPSKQGVAFLGAVVLGTTPLLVMTPLSGPLRDLMVVPPQGHPSEGEHRSKRLAIVLGILATLVYALGLPTVLFALTTTKSPSAELLCLTSGSVGIISLSGCLFHASSALKP
jgi:hypothetical protein